VRLKILSAADRHYFRTLWQFLLSAERTGTLSDHEAVIYDLGLEQRQRDRLWARFSLDTRRFEFERQPPHVAELAHCAWKPLVIERELAEGPLLWLDAGTVLHTGLDRVVRALRERGLYTLLGQAELREWCHPATFEAMKVPPEHYDRRVRVGGVLGFDGARPEIRRLARRWRDFALDPHCIAPDGSSRANHRYDQSLLNNVLQRAADEGEIRLDERDEIDIGSTAPVSFLSSRNLVAASLPNWADPWIRTARASWKALDRAALRLKRIHAGPLSGLDRLSKEHFQIELRAPTRNASPRAPATHYWADPFLAQHAGEAWLFVEEFDALRNKGHISALALDRDEPARPVLERPWHLSFPNVFERDGRFYMLPESSAHGTIDLYVCDSFPGGWRLHRRLMHGIDAADSVQFEHGGRVWLHTAVRDPSGGAGRSLALFHADRFDSREWRPHPINEAGLYRGLPHSSGRNAGPPFRVGEHWVRPVQINRDYYGQCLAFHRIDRLSVDDYHESRIELPDRPTPPSSHHHHRAHGREVWDVRDRVGRSDTLRALFGLRRDPRLARCHDPATRIGPGIT